MQVSITNVSEVQQEADIQLTQEELQPMFEQAYEKYRPKVEIKGFRKGKVPMPMIRQLYGEAIEQDALDDIASDFYRKAMEEKDIHPVGQPTMVDMDFKRGDHFHFKIKYEVKPGITLGTLQGDQGRETDPHRHRRGGRGRDPKIRRANSTTEDAPAVTDTGFIVTADVQELDESGTPLIGKKTPARPIRPVGRDARPGDLRRRSRGAATGGRRTARSSNRCTATTPTRCTSPLTVTKVEKVRPPAFDDELITKITGGKNATVDEFRKNLRTDIERYWDEESTARLNDNIAKSLVESHPFPIPDSIVNGLLDSYVDDVRNRSRDRKLPKGFDEQKFREENRASATWQAQWLLLSGRIAEEEKIAVTEEEVAAMAEREAGKIGIDKERMLEYYRKSSSARSRILSDKLMDVPPLEREDHRKGHRGYTAASITDEGLIMRM